MSLWSMAGAGLQQYLETFQKHRMEVLLNLNWRTVSYYSAALLLVLNKMFKGLLYVYIVR